MLGHVQNKSPSARSQTSGAAFTGDSCRQDMHAVTIEDQNVVRVDVSGKLTQDDYDKLIPGWKAAIAHYGKLRLLFVMKDFHGWEPGAAVGESVTSNRL